MHQATDNFRTRDYWFVENARFAAASFRLKKCARIINRIAAGRPCKLLDVGCGPAALQHLLAPNINYFGIDIAIHERAENLRETDIARETITFDDQRFDFVVAMGFFEYMGHLQKRKFEEICRILTSDGKFIMSYVNFNHFSRKIWPNYNNVESPGQMADSLKELFRIEKRFPASHHWRQKQPGRNSLQGIQMQINFNIPLISRLLAVEYFFVCSPRTQNAPPVK